MRSGTKADRSLSVLLLIIGATIVLCVSAWLFFLAQESAVQSGYMNGIAKSNERAAGTMADFLEKNATSAEDAAEILSGFPSDGITYWSLYSADIILFEKNAQTTELLDGMTLDDVSDHYVRQGGKGSAELFRLMRENTTFSIIMEKDKSTGNELISGEYATINGEEFCVTLSILQSYLLSSGRIGETILFLRILFAGILLVLAASVCYLLINNRRKDLQISVMSQELKTKNILIQEQGDRLFVDEGDDSTTDTRTGLYTKSFFDVIIEQLSERQDVHTGFLAIRLDNVSKLYGKAGYQKVTALIQDAAEIILQNTTEQDIAARVGKAEFAIALFHTNADSVHRLSRKLSVALADLDIDATFSCGEAFADPGEIPAHAYEEARKAAGIL